MVHRNNSMCANGHLCKNEACQEGAGPVIYLHPIMKFS